MATEEEITLNFFVDKANQRVVFAETDGKIVDVLLSFLTVPISTLVKLSDGDELSPSFSLPGRIRNLRQSVETMETTHFTSEASKSMLLHPLNAAAETLRSLKVNLDDVHSHKFYLCDDLGIDPLDVSDHSCLLSHGRGAVCECGEPMTYEVCLPVNKVYSYGEVVYVKNTLRYVITDDLYVSCASTYEALLQMEELGVRKEQLEERKISIKRPQIPLLLQAALASDTALTTMFLHCEQREVVSHIPPKLRPPNLYGSPQVKKKAEKLISIRLLVNKASDKVLHAEAKEDFIDLLFSFLIYPIGTVVRLLRGDCNIRCLNNLYRSAHQLDNDSKASHGKIRQEIIKPRLPPYYNTSKMRRLWDIPVKEPLNYYLCEDSDCKDCGTCRLSLHPGRPNFAHPPKQVMSLIDPIEGAYLKERKLFSVTDELVISPLCVQSQLSKLHTAGISFRQIEEKTVNIGTEEALALLKSCLTSRQVLTDAFFEKESKGKPRVR